MPVIKVKVKVLKALWSISVHAPKMSRWEFNPIFKSLQNVVPELYRVGMSGAGTDWSMTEEEAALEVYNILLTNQLTPAFRVYKEKGTRQIHIHLGNFLMDLPPVLGRGAKDRIIIEKAWGGYR